MKMRDLINTVSLMESVYYEGPIDTDYGGKIDHIVILKNPSKGELTRLRTGSQYSKVRGLLDDDLFAWDAALATHSDIAKALSVDGSDLHLEPHGIKVNDLAPDCDDEEAARNAHWIQTHPLIIRLYGENVPLELESPDQMKTWNF